MCAHLCSHTVSYAVTQVGAILSNYQRVRVEAVCERLGLKTLAFLWQRDQSELLSEVKKRKLKDYPQDVIFFNS